MFRLTPPLDEEVRSFIANQEHAELSYPEVGASADSVPDGYTVDHNRIELGSGERVWQRAVAAVSRVANVQYSVVTSVLA